MTKKARYRTEEKTGGSSVIDTLDPGWPNGVEIAFCGHSLSDGVVRSGHRQARRIVRLLNRHEREKGPRFRDRKCS